MGRLAPEWGKDVSSVLYPSQSSCPVCRAPPTRRATEVVWNEEEVEGFLSSTYKCCTSTAADESGHVLLFVVYVAAFVGVLMVVLAAVMYWKCSKDPAGHVNLV